MDIHPSAMTTIDKNVSMYLSIYPSIYLSTYLPIYRSYPILSHPVLLFYLIPSLYLILSILSVLSSLSIVSILSILPYLTYLIYRYLVCLSIFLSVCLSIYLRICLSTFYLSATVSMKPNMLENILEMLNHASKHQSHHIFCDDMSILGMSESWILAKLNALITTVKNSMFRFRSLKCSVRHFPRWQQNLPRWKLSPRSLALKVVSRGKAWNPQICPGINKRYKKCKSSSWWSGWHWVRGAIPYPTFFFRYSTGTKFVTFVFRRGSRYWWHL